MMICDAARKVFGDSAITYDTYLGREGTLDFPVLMQDERVVSSHAISQVLRRLPVVATEYVFVDPAKREEALRWLECNREAVITPPKEAT